MPDPFHVRFNIDVPIEEARRRFINRIENRVRRIADHLRKIYERGTGKSLNDIMIDVETELGYRHETSVDYSANFAEVWGKRVNNELLLCLRAIEGLRKCLNGILGHSLGLLSELDEAVTTTLAESECDIGISWENGSFQRKGAELLDQKLVNEPLRWLADPRYQNVLVPFRKGLSHMLEGTKEQQRYGDAVTDMYEALEAMAKVVTGKAKDLSALREEFISKLKLSDSHKRMLKEYIDYGCEFRHAIETGQKRAWPLEHEAENFVYMTGLFIRLSIQAQKVNS